jgi:ferredoxin
MPKVKIANRGETYAVERNATVLNGIRKANGQFRSYCDMKAMCGTCSVLVVAGEISEPDRREQTFIDGWGFHPAFRIACHARVLGDVTVISCDAEDYDPERCVAAYDSALAEIDS